jgi:hypothetical protein
MHYTFFGLAGSQGLGPEAKPAVFLRSGLTGVVCFRVGVLLSGWIGVFCFRVDWVFCFRVGVCYVVWVLILG